MARYGREVDWQATALSYERENGMLVESLFQFEAERDSALAGESAALEEVARLREDLDGARAEHGRICDAAQRLLEVFAPGEWGDMPTSMERVASQMRMRPSR